MTPTAADRIAVLCLAVAAGIGIGYGAHTPHVLLVSVALCLAGIALTRWAYRP